jgi:hypothetical protein
LIDEDERGRIAATSAQLSAAREGTDRELIGRLVEGLNELTTPFAGRIMDQAIKLALEKKSVEDVF